MKYLELKKELEELIGFREIKTRDICQKLHDKQEKIKLIGDCEKMTEDLNRICSIYYKYRDEIIFILKRFKDIKSIV